MEKPEYFEQVGTRGYYRPVGEVTLEQAITMITGAMIYARENGMTDLLANVLGLSAAAYTQVTIFDRYAFAVRWAESARSSLRVVIVTRPDIIDPDKVGLLMVQNRGVSGEVFTNEADAIAWLDGNAS